MNNWSDLFVQCTMYLSSGLKFNPVVLILFCFVLIGHGMVVCTCMLMSWKQRKMKGSTNLDSLCERNLGENKTTCTSWVHVLFPNNRSWQLDKLQSIGTQLNQVQVIETGAHVHKQSRSCKEKCVSALLRTTYSHYCQMPATQASSSVIKRVVQQC